MRLRLLCAGVVGMLWTGLTLNGAAAQGAAPAPRVLPGATAFVDVAVIPMDTERVLPGQTVLVESGRIIALGPVGNVKLPAGATRIDGRGKYLIPGLADMHVHMQEALAVKTDPGAAENFLFRWLSRGVTTLRSISAHTSAPQILQIQAQVANGTIVGPRLYASTRWYRGPVGNPNATAPEAISSLITAYKAAGYDFVKPYYESSAVFDSVAAAARRVGIPLAGHIPPGITLAQAFAAPMKSIEHLTGYIASLPDTAQIWASFSTDTSMVSALAIQRIGTAGSTWLFRDTSSVHLRALAVATARAGIWNCPTQGIYENIFASTNAHVHAELIPLRRRFIKALQDAGAGLLLGTDNGLQSPEFELAALVRAGLTPYQALVTGTRNVAAYFGTLDSTGTIAVGKRADLVLLTGNPLVNVQHVVQPAGVMVSGHWLDRATLDRREALGSVGELPPSPR
jgi:imidazolonepropionase-like amidohydrolase